MKLDGNTLFAVALMVGALGAVGCSNGEAPAKAEAAKPAAATPAAAADDDGAIAPEETPASAPVEDPSKAGIENHSRWSWGARAYYAPHAPPAARYEARGRAPSSRHFWANGYWRWSGRQYTWYGGRWEPQRVGYSYYAPTWRRHHTGRYVYVPGHWERR